MALVIRVSRSQMQALYTHATRCFPTESVALLFGHYDDGVATVTRVECVENTARSTVRFSVNPETQYRLLAEAEELGESLVGIFHSHPAGPHPSSTDLHYMRLNPVVWIIASMTDGHWQTAAFRLRDDCLVSVDIELYC